MVATNLKSQAQAGTHSNNQAANHDTTVSARRGSVSTNSVDSELNTSLTERALSEHRVGVDVVSVQQTAQRVRESESLLDTAMSPEASRFRDIEIYNSKVVQNSGLKRALPLQDGSFVTVSNDRHNGAERGDTLRLWIAA